MLPFKFKLPGVIQKLPFAAAAVPAVSTTRRYPERLRFDKFNNPRLGICFLLFNNPDNSPVAWFL